MLRRLFLMIAAGLVLFSPCQAGGEWLESLSLAQDRAQRVDRPILLLSMFGRLDERWC
ncbi:MAG: hypothetical protein AMXMBFR33_49180 [Candidatus Xenobia bacterium]|jgi:hypothetical protein